MDVGEFNIDWDYDISEEKKCRVFIRHREENLTFMEPEEARILAAALVEMANVAELKNAGSGTL